MDPMGNAGQSTLVDFSQNKSSDLHSSSKYLPYEVFFFGSRVFLGSKFPPQSGVWKLRVIPKSKDSLLSDNSPIFNSIPGTCYEAPLKPLKKLKKPLLCEDVVPGDPITLTWKQHQLTTRCCFFSQAGERFLKIICGMSTFPRARSTTKCIHSRYEQWKKPLFRV